MMTPRRQQVLDCIERYKARDLHVSLSRIAKECGLYAATDARRIVNDLRELGAL